MDFHTDGAGNEQFTISHHQDPKAAIEVAKARAKQLRESKTTKGPMRQVAEIPLTLIYKWLQDDGLDVFNPEHGNRLRKKLDSREYRYLRTDNTVLGHRNLK